MASSVRIALALFLSLIAAACRESPKPPSEPPPAAEPAGEEVAVVETGSGKIVLRFHAAEAPKTVAEFKRLASRNFWDGTIFHRVNPGKLIQGGDPLSRDRDPYNDGTGNSGVFVPAEFGKRPFKRGTVGLARGPDPDSGSCQFFICLTRRPEWDGNYTPFAEVIEGIEVADEISKAQTNPKIERTKERPIREQLIKTIRLERRKL